MKTPTVKRSILYLLLGFVLIYLLRFAYILYDDYRYTSYYDTPEAYYINSYDSEYGGSAFKNLATARQYIADTGGVALNYDQKYEMISSLSAYTARFDDDEALLRQAVEQHQGIVQTEHRSGLEGSRSLMLSVGIPPAKFDDLVESAKGIAQITSFSVDKIDRTADFLALLARQEALEKTLESYQNLKEQSGDMGDKIVLEEKIISCEQEILQLKVDLGVFDEKQSMCTVEYRLSETQNTTAAPAITLDMVVSAATDALLWTLLCYFLILFFLVGTGLCAIGLTFIWGRIGVSKAQPAPTAGESGKGETP